MIELRPDSQKRRMLRVLCWLRGCDCSGTAFSCYDGPIHCHYCHSGDSDNINGNLLTRMQVFCWPLTRWVMEKQNRLHRCSNQSPERDQIIHYGVAVSLCFETDDHKLWVKGGIGDEYGNQVNFCPFCGFEASVKI